VTFSYSYKYDDGEERSCIHELHDKDVFHPDAENVGFVVSNYAHTYLPKWSHLDKIVIEQEKLKRKQLGTKRGRKPKPVVEKKSGHKHFMSAITFGVVSPTNPDRIHGIKMFRKNCGNIANLTYSDSKEYVAELVNKLFRFIENSKPGLHIEYLGHKKELSNTITTYEHMDGRVINLFKLRNIVNTCGYDVYYWGCISKIEIIFDQTNYTIKFSEAVSMSAKGKLKSVTYTCRITPIGDLYVYGGNSDSVANRYIENFWRILEKHENEVLGVGYPSKKKKSPKL
jgi:hypothetical protein